MEFKQQTFTAPCTLMEAKTYKDKAGVQQFSVRWNTPYGPCGGRCDQGEYTMALRCREESDGEGELVFSLSSASMLEFGYPKDVFVYRFLSVKPFRWSARTAAAGSEGRAARQPVGT